MEGRGRPRGARVRLVGVRPGAGSTGGVVVLLLGRAAAAAALEGRGGGSGRSGCNVGSKQTDNRAGNLTINLTRNRTRNLTHYRTGNLARNQACYLAAHLIGCFAEALAYILACRLNVRRV